MKSDIIEIQSDLSGKEDAFKAADGFIAYNRLEGKNAMHIRLLTEELVSMVHGIMDKFRGSLWFESENTDDGVLCRICLSAKRGVDPKEEEHFLSVSSSGKNENAKGVLGKIREAFRVSAQHSADGFYMNEYVALNNWYSMGSHRFNVQNEELSEQYWSLANYIDSLSRDSNDSKEEWDELEKSIIARLADDVKVWLKIDTTEVVIEKLIKK